MNYTKKHIFLNQGFQFLFLAALIISCRSQKESVFIPEIGFNQFDNLSSKKLASEEIFYSALKYELIESNADLAIKEYYRCLSMDPNNAAAMYRLASLQMKRKNPAEAQRLMEKATSLFPKNKYYRLLLADALLAQSSFNAAARNYEILLKDDPSNISIYIKLANTYLMNNEGQKAIEVYDRLESKAGINPDIISRKKDIYIKLKKFDRAISEVNRLIASDSFNTDYLRMLIDVYMLQFNEEKVIETYRRILEINPSDGQAMLILADHYYRKGNMEKTMEWADKAFRNKNLDIDNKVSFLAFNLMSNGVRKEDEASLKKLTDLIVEIHPESSKSYAIRGDFRAETKNNDAALIDYKKALSLEKGAVLLWKKYVSLLIDSGKYPEADSAAEEALSYFPNNPEIYFLNGLALMKLLNYDKAVRIFLEGINYCYRDQRLKFQFQYQIADCYNSLKNYSESDKYFNELITSNPNDAFTLNNYAYFLSLRKEKLDLAKDMAWKALNSEPENPAYLDTYGWIMYLTGNYQEALKYIEKALSKKPWDSDILEHYGDVMFRLGNVEKAVEYWQKAQAKGAGSALLEKKIRERKLYEE